MAKSYYPYLIEELGKLDVDTLIEISQYLHNEGITTSKHTKPTDDDVRKYFNIQGDISLVEFLNKILEKSFNDMDFRDTCCCIGSVDALYISENGIVYLECKDDMIYELIDAIVEDIDKGQDILSCINNKFNFNIQLKSEYEENHKGEEED